MTKTMGPMQGGKTPIYSLLRSLSLVKMLTCLIFALTLEQGYNFALTFDYRQLLLIALTQALNA